MTAWGDQRVIDWALELQISSTCISSLDFGFAGIHLLLWLYAHFSRLRQSPSIHVLETIVNDVSHGGKCVFHFINEPQD